MMNFPFIHRFFVFLKFNFKNEKYQVSGLGAEDIRGIQVSSSGTIISARSYIAFALDPSEDRLICSFIE